MKQVFESSSNSERSNVRDRARDSVERIHRMFADAIDSGKLAPGEKLPTEAEMTRNFEVSRNIVRKVLAQLEKEGRIVRRVGSGTFVADATSISVASPALDRARTLESVTELASPLEIMDFRLAIEPPAMLLVARYANHSDIAEMHACLRRGNSAGSLEEFEHWDCELHRVFGRATRNVLFDAAYETFSTARNRAEWGQLKERSLTAERRSHHAKEHGRIVDAIQNRDPEEARQLMLDHLTLIKREMFQD